MCPGNRQVKPWPRTVGIEPDHALPAAQGVELGVGDHRQARGRAAEALERVEQLGARGPVRVMVELDVGDDCDLRAQREEAGVALVGLRDDPRPLSPTRIGALAVRAHELAADQERGVRAGRAQDVGDHPRRRRLPVRARHRDKPALGAHLGEQLAPMEDRLLALPGARQLGVVLGDRRRDDDLGVLGHRVSVVAHARREPRRPEAFHVGRVGAVAPAHPRPEPVGDQREAAHSGPADGDEVQPPVLPLRHIITSVRLIGSPRGSRPRFARRRRGGRSISRRTPSARAPRGRRAAHPPSRGASPA